MQNFKEAGEAGRALIAAHVIEGGPGDPDTLELAATLCNFAPAMVEALRWIKDEYCEGGMLDGTKIEERICAILARIEGTPTAQPAQGWTPNHLGQGFRVRWEIDADADTPEAAAREAFAAMQRPGTTATFFEVIDGTGTIHEIDLSAQPAETFTHLPERCPSQHWNRGDDICADCGTDLNA